jgi:ABC-type sulfate transport system substrate-binding protein
MGGDSVQQTLRYGMERAFFDERISNIKKKFKQAFGVDVTVKIEIANLNRVTGNIINTSKAPIGAYGLSMDVDQIVIQIGL